MAKPVLLDTSAIFCFVDNETGAETVERYLRVAERRQLRLLASFVTLTEIRSISLQEQGAVAADYLTGLVKAWPVEWIHSDETICLLAAHYKAKHQISLADAFVASTAKLMDATLVHKDPELEPLGDEISLESLPYKKT
ncbi:MAG: PIN domain-containing protein [Verrucomicrobia bacterium]|nr:PIN domain-containing protein [Verrucomicrobiota bacterium]